MRGLDNVFVRGHKSKRENLQNSEDFQDFLVFKQSYFDVFSYFKKVFWGLIIFFPSENVTFHSHDGRFVDALY